MLWEHIHSITPFLITGIFVIVFTVRNLSKANWSRDLLFGHFSAFWGVVIELMQVSKTNKTSKFSHFNRLVLSNTMSKPSKISLPCWVSSETNDENEWHISGHALDKCKYPSWPDKFSLSLPAGFCYCKMQIIFKRRTVLVEKKLINIWITVTC